MAALLQRGPDNSATFSNTPIWRGPIHEEEEPESNTFRAFEQNNSLPVWNVGGIENLTFPILMVPTMMGGSFERKGTSSFIVWRREKSWKPS